MRWNAIFKPCEVDVITYGLSENKRSKTEVQVTPKFKVLGDLLHSLSLPVLLPSLHLIFWVFSHTVKNEPSIGNYNVCILLVIKC